MLSSGLKALWKPSVAKKKKKKDIISDNKNEWRFTYNDQKEKETGSVLSSLALRNV